MGGRYFFIGLMLFLAGCAGTPKPTLPRPAEAQTIQALCQKYNMDCRWDGLTQTMTMQYAGRTIQAMVGSHVVVVGAEHLPLPEPLTRRNGAVIIPAGFENMVFGVPAEPQEEPVQGKGTAAVMTVVIDAGHGGKDPGAIGVGGVKEKDITLDIARRVQRGFQAAGVKVIMTREGDEYPTLESRTYLTSQPGVDVFISIHANSSKSRSAHGVEVFDSGFLSSKDKASDQHRINEKRLLSLLSMERNVPVLEAIVLDLLYKHKMVVSPGLAEAVNHGFKQGSFTVVREKKSERFHVLRNTLVPAILVETGFVSNVKEAALLQKPVHRQKIADVIVRSVLKRLYEYNL
jgi:N-acetylmuramoyl-L-alanine amidase